MNTIDLDQLTPEQIEHLKAQVIADEKAKEKAREREIEIYKDLVKKTVGEQIIVAQDVSNMLSLAKAQFFGGFAAIISMKQELYGVKSGQQTHTFSDDNSNSITLGWRIVDDYDDTFDMGLSLVKEYLHSLSPSEKEEQSDFMEIINILLKKNAKGNLKLSRVMELKQFAVKKQNPVLLKGVTIIENSYKPKRTKIFVEAEIPDAQGVKQAVGLSITSVDFPQGFEPNFEVFK